MTQKTQKLNGIPVLKNFVKSKDLDAYLAKSGKLLFKDYSKITKFVHDNQDLDFSAGELYAMNLLNKLYLAMIEYYEENIFPACFNKLKINLEQKLNKRDLDFVGKKFFEEYNIKENEVKNSSQLFSELILVWLNNKNIGLKKYSEIFDYTTINSEQHFEKLMDGIEIFFSEEKEFKQGLNLLQYLYLPVRLFPDSLSKQLGFIKENWSQYLGDISKQLLRSQDYLKEEHKKFVAGGFADTRVPVFNEEEPERFSMDEHWMPNLILIAKNIHVWLEQLSRKYERWIRYFDDIPDEELNLLKERGITGIWFIGIWERSPISRQIKHLTGNVEAESSAYSVRNYKPASDLGGWESLQKIKSRARSCGIRLGVDMVPNHTGLDSDWIVEHPDWFLSVDEPPYPGYSFNGKNLSERDEIEVYLEDHYYDNSDAAVVFKLYHKIRNKVYYIYHGNDGTGLPWNDTAQLDYLNPEVREAVIEKIVQIAGSFSIIRFDAAMTLAKRHIRRLWYPEPGEGGDIPSRSAYGMSREEFGNIMPYEFWRQVVDRVEDKVPDTLLLAEAFWMMEGYFVRTLGMHRVYNSAFMNMLKNEKNRNFKQLIYDVLQFNPGILKRFVNFMSNPDEETAIDQFGSDGKYFGTCVLMSTLPGLPMFAHGQIEGFSEKYGMDFLKPKLFEKENENLIKRHQREIFPLLRQRYLFSEVENFHIFNFITDDGSVNDDVISYFNNNSSKKTVVVFNNKFSNSNGNIDIGINYNRRQDENSFLADEHKIFDILGIDKGDEWLMFKDITSDEEFLRPVNEIVGNGLRLELKAFQYHVFMYFTTFKDDEKAAWQKLFNQFGYQGLDSWSKQYKLLEMGPVLEPCQAIINKQVFSTMFAMKKTRLKSAGFLPEFEFRLEEFEDAVTDFLKLKKPLKLAACTLKKFKQYFELPTMSFEGRKKEYLVFIWIFIYNFEYMMSQSDIKEEKSENVVNIKFLIDDFLIKFYGGYEIKLNSIFAFFLKHKKSPEKYESVTDYLANLLQLEQVKKLINVNEWEDKVWYDKQLMEYFYQILWYYFIDVRKLKLSKKLQQEIVSTYALLEKSEYQYNLLLNLLEEKSHGKK